MKQSATFVTIASFICIAHPALAGDWPQFRGPNQGHADATNLPLELSEDANVTWKSPIPGRGWSSPVVLGNQIWMTTAIETAATPDEAKKLLAGNPQAGERVAVKRIELQGICVDRQTGKLLHQISLFTVDGPEVVHTLNSFASPTPALEPGRVYCHFGTFGTACINTGSGQIVWKRKLAMHHEVGPGSSPVIYKNLLVIVCDGTDVQYVTALDKGTGETKWKTDRPPIRRTDGSFRKAFCTPLIVEAAGKEQMIIPGAQWFISYEPATGKMIWQIDHGDGYSNVPQAVSGDGMVFICTGFDTPQLWAMRVDGTGDVTQTHVAWKVKQQAPKKPSPLLVGKELYTVSDLGVVSCFDAKTGKQNWKGRVEGDYSASPIFADGHIYLCSQEGITSVLQPGAEFKKLSEGAIKGKIMATPAFVDNAIFLRSDTHLYQFNRAEKK